MALQMLLFYWKYKQILAWNVYLLLIAIKQLLREVILAYTVCK